jgi:hypothetical protein
LTRSGIPEESIASYERAVKSGSFLLLACGAADVIEHAQAVLGPTGASQLVAHAT